MFGLGPSEILGIVLIPFLIYELVAGYVYFPNKVTRADKPAQYWTGIVIYALLIASCFVWF